MVQFATCRKKSGRHWNLQISRDGVLTFNRNMVLSSGIDYLRTREAQGVTAQHVANAGAGSSFAGEVFVCSSHSERSVRWKSEATFDDSSCF